MKTYRFKYLEITLGLKRHFSIRYLPYGFGYENPLFILSLFFISFYLNLNFIKYKEIKDSDIDYGIQFFDDDERHWLPDNIRISFGNLVWSKPMFYKRVYFSKYYETKQANNIFMKDISTLVKAMKSFKFEALVRPKEDPEHVIRCYYYKEILIFKFKIFGKFIDKFPKEYHRLEVEFTERLRDMNAESIYLPNSEKCEEAFKNYCNERNLEII